MHTLDRAPYDALACVIIAHKRRRALALGRVLTSVVAQDFDEIVLVGDWPDDDTPLLPAPARYLCVTALRADTIDGLVKRDVGALATRADTLVYVNDDHVLAPRFAEAVRAVLSEPWDVIVPNRYTIRCMPGSGDKAHIPLNNGADNEYCGGHGGVFRRDVLRARPWSAHKHTLFWDFESSRDMRARGARFIWHPRAEIALEDIEPNATPWK